jgi:hypothetical protein
MSGPKDLNREHQQNIQLTWLYLYWSSVHIFHQSLSVESPRQRFWSSLSWKEYLIEIHS